MVITQNYDDLDDWVSEQGILTIHREDGKHLVGEYKTYGSPASWDYYGSLEELIEDPQDVLNKAQDMYFDHSWKEFEVEWDDLNG